jgi:DNA-binding response OmpR family regulator
MKTVLIVEDEPFLRAVLPWELKERGLRVIAGNGKAAIDVIHTQTPDLLLLDLLIPHMDGFAVLAWLRASGHAVPTILLSNLSDPQTRQQCLEAGAAEFIVKSTLEEKEK